MSTKIQVYVLGLEKNFRGQELISGLTNLGFQPRIVYGPDASFWSENEFAELYDRKRARVITTRDMSKGEVACVLGHRMCYENFIATKGEWALILEDDALLITDLSEVDTVISQLSSSPQIISLFHHGGLQRRKIVETINLDQNYVLESRVPAPFGTVGYLINKSGAEIAMTAYQGRKVDSPADWPFRWSDKLLFYELTPQPIGHPVENDKSTITLDRKVIQDRFVGMRKIFQDALNFIYAVTGMRALRGRFLGISFKRLYMRDVRSIENKIIRFLRT